MQSFYENTQMDHLTIQISHKYMDFLLFLQTVRVSDRDFRTVIGRTRHLTSPIWSRIDWPTGPKIRIVGFSLAEL